MNGNQAKNRRYVILIWLLNRNKTSQNETNLYYTNWFLYSKRSKETAGHFFFMGVGGGKEL